MVARGRYWLHPLLVGLFLGLVQTGLFLQLTVTLSSSIGTYLMTTLCWLIGSALSVLFLRRVAIPLTAALLVTLLAYSAVGLLLVAAPFETGRWPLFAGLILIIGVYPGLFFARMTPYYRAKSLLFRENNGFILGLVSGTLLFLLLGRPTLWLGPFTAAVAVLVTQPRTLPVSIDQVDNSAKPV